MSRLLIVEDENHLAQGLQFNLAAEGHSAQVVGDGESALQVLLHGKEHFDAVLLDVMLPGKDGFSVAAELRTARNYIPILMLTARGRPEDVLKGFAAGADDYLPKPFDLPILIARLQGLLRRRQWLQEQSATLPAVKSPAPEFETFSFHGRNVDFGKLELRVNGNTIQLTLMEAELLRHLIQNEGRNVSRKAILEQVWGLHEDTDTRAIDNFIVRLRRYIEENPSKPRHLLTVRGIGYRFVTEPQPDPLKTAR